MLYIDFYTSILLEVFISFMRFFPWSLVCGLMSSVRMNTFTYFPIHMPLFPSLVYCSARTSRTDRVPLTDELHLLVYVWWSSLRSCNKAHLIMVNDLLGVCQCFIRSFYIYVHRGDCLEFSLSLCFYLGFGILERVESILSFHVLENDLNSNAVSFSLKFW